MSLASIVYIPPITFKSTSVFVDNLQRFPPNGRLIVISDYNYTKQLPKAEHVFLRTSPELFTGHAMNQTSGISNALFVVAMRTALQKGIKHALYLEADCRVGRRGWDAAVFEEYHTIPFPVLAAGTIMAWNVFNGGMEWVKRYQQLVLDTKDAPCPVHSYGIFPHNDNAGNPKACNPTLFPNGAATVMNVGWMKELFGGFDNMMEIATGQGMEGKAWDWQMGERARKKFGADVFDLFYHLRSVCSCYGDLTTTEDYRLDLLRQFKVSISHQHKGTKTV